MSSGDAEPVRAEVERIELAPGYTIPRIVRGGWQLAGDHGEVDRDRATAEIERFVDAGLDTVDGADIYTGVEAIYGEFNRHRRSRGQAPLQVHTKCVPDRDELARSDRAAIRRIVHRSLQRLNAERLDLVQLHWWDYGVPGMVDAVQALFELRDEGAIRLVGGTNFDSASVVALRDAGTPLASIQVQYSLLDRRAERGMVASGVPVLAYGTLAGGFFHERWLGAAEPGAEVTNRSLIKYKLVIDDWGGWAAFQRLLAALKTIADRHGTGIAAVATRWVLDRPGVAAAIVGARYADHLPQTLAVFGLRLTDADRELLAPILHAHPGPEGDCYALERDMTGRHGRIMKYNLNKGGAGGAGAASRPSTAMPTSVRRAVSSDLAALIPLFDAYRQFYRRPSDPAAAESFLRRRFEHAESVVFLALNGAEAVGFTQLYPSFSSVSLAPVFILNDLFVVPAHRRSGVASQLLDAAVDHARAHGAVRVSLNTDVANTAAQATYEARGWKRDREYHAYHFAPQAEA